MNSESELNPTLSPTITPLRKGKIGRLPLKVREELNMRLADGMEAMPLLAWLNALPDVRNILRCRFASRPVSPQNLSEWRQGGFQDWVLRREVLHEFSRIHSADLATRAKFIEEKTSAESNFSLIHAMVPSE